MKTVHVTAFAYDVLDRLIAESGFNHKLTGYHYNAGNELVEQRELGDDASLAAKLIAQLGGQPVPPPKKKTPPRFQTTSKTKPASFGTAATSCKKSTRTADIPTSTPTKIPTNRWRKSAIGQPKKAKTDSKPAISIATTSASRAK